MLPKSKYPYLNRATRRHPKKFMAADLGKGWPAATSFLLSQLMMRIGAGPATKYESDDRTDPNFGAQV